VPYPILSLESIPPVEPYLSRRRAHADDCGAQMAFAAVLFERETYYTAMYTPYGLHGATPPASHEVAWQPYPVTAKGREALAAFRELADLREMPFDLFGLKSEALHGLQSVLRPRKRDLSGYLLAARFALDLCEADAAIAVLDVADQLSPDHHIALGYRYAAGVGGMDRRLRKVLGPNWSREISRGRDTHHAQIRRHAWRARTEAEGERFTRFLTTEQAWCERARDEATASLDEQLVPESFRSLLPLARRYGVGDDPCRGLFISKTPKPERKRHLALAEPHLDDIQRWTDSFEAGSMPPEATVFFWLLEALEEMR
jgi:hypothetical protein